MVVGVFVLQQGNGKLRSPNTEVSPYSLLIYNIQSALSVISICFRRNRQTIQKENFQSCALWRHSQTMAQLIFCCIWFSWALLAGSNCKICCWQMRRAALRPPHTHTKTPLFCALESCAPVIPLLCKNCVIWGKLLNTLELKFPLF